MDRAAIQAQIDAIQDILDTGVTSVSHNGRTTTYDLNALRRTQNALRAQLNANQRGSRTRRVIYNPRAVDD